MSRKVYIWISEDPPGVRVYLGATVEEIRKSLPVAPQYEMCLTKDPDYTIDPNDADADKQIMDIVHKHLPENRPINVDLIEHESKDVKVN